MFGDPLGPEIWPHSDNMFLSHRLFGVIPTVENSVDNYVEWYCQKTKRINVGARYAHVILV